MIVTFSEKQYNACLAIARARNTKESVFGAMTYRGVRGSLEAHVLGIVPEAAVAMILGLRVDRTVRSERGDDGYNLDSPEGRVSVKTTTYTCDPWLRVEEDQLHEADRFVCCAYGGGLSVDVVGWASREMLDSPEAKSGRLVTGGPLNRILPARMLVAMEDWR